MGYVQNVTAEDLEKHEGEGYTANSVIGRSGMEGLFEKELKGQTGYRIYIADGDGTEKKELANRVVENGKDITLTIDSQIQAILYGQFKEDESCSVAMNPYTGEVLALVSTPSYNNNNFILGMSQAQWESLNGDERQPLCNRFRQVWCPGSSFKPVTAAVGLETGAVDPEEDFGKEGLSWQKDSSWGSYYVTTLHEYEPVVLENALIYSDNIYFAKAALKIGGDKMKEYLQKLGFDEPLPFEISMAASQYSNSESIETGSAGGQRLRTRTDSGEPFASGLYLYGILQWGKYGTALSGLSGGSPGGMVDSGGFFRSSGTARVRGVEKNSKQPGGNWLRCPQGRCGLGRENGNGRNKGFQGGYRRNGVGMVCSNDAGTGCENPYLNREHGRGCERTGRQRLCGRKNEPGYGNTVWERL